MPVNVTCIMNVLGIFATHSHWGNGIAAGVFPLTDARDCQITQLWLATTPFPWDETALLLVPLHGGNLSDVFRLNAANIKSIGVSFDSRLFAIAVLGGKTCLWNATDFILEVFDVYSLKQELIVEKIGSLNKTLSLKQQLFQLVSQSPAPRRSNFHGARLEVLGDCRLQYGSECQIDNSTGAAVFERGLAVSILRDFEAVLNFSDTALNAGHLHFTGNVTELEPNDIEMFDRVKQGTIDLVISQNIFRPSLAEYTTLLHPTSAFPLQAYFRQPRRRPGSIFVKPFSLAAWCAIGGFWVVIGIIALCIELVTRSGPDTMGARLGGTASDLTMWCIGTMCKRSVSSLLTMRCRVILLVALVTAILTHSAYEAGFVMTLSTHFLPIHSFHDLVQGGYSFVVNQHSASIREITQELFNMNGTMLNYSRMSEEDAVASISLRKSAYVEYFHTFHGALRVHYHGQEASPDWFFCKSVSAVQVETTVVKAGMVLPKGSPFRDVFNTQIIRLMEVGLRLRYFQIYERETEMTCLPPQLLWRSRLGLVDLALAFEIVLVGFALSLGILMIELITEIV